MTMKPIGEQHGQAKLTELEVREIRKLYADGGFRRIDLARQFKVSATTIGYVVHRKIWAHVD